MRTDQMQNLSAVKAVVVEIAMMTTGFATVFLAVGAFLLL